MNREFAWSFTCLSNIHPPVFVCKEYLLCLRLCEALPVLLFLNLHPHLQLRKFPILVLLSFLQSRPNEVAFLSSHFENPLSRTSYFLDGFQLKKQNMPFKCNMVDYFHTTHKVDGKGFLSHISTLKIVPSDQKSNCCARAEGWQMPFNLKRNRSWRKSFAEFRCEKIKCFIRRPASCLVFPGKFPCVCWAKSYVIDISASEKQNCLFYLLSLEFRVL